MSIYIVSKEKLTIEKIITSPNSITISCISFSTLTENLIAFGLTDRSLYIWNYEEDKALVHLALPSTPKMIEWSPLNGEELMFVVEDGTFKTLNISQKKVEKTTFPSKYMVTVFRYHPKKEGIIAAGCSDGSIVFFNSLTKKGSLCKSKTAVEDIQWNPHEDYILVCYKGGYLKVIELMQTEECSNFDRQGQGIKSIAWINNMSGDFLSATEKVGTIKVWNVAQK
jgi:WD40 repeat protein